MELVFVRHAIAEERAEWNGIGLPDETRPLTIRGSLRMEQAAAGLLTVVERCDEIWSSPLTRAMQTAEIIGQQYGCSCIRTIECLSPGAAAEEVVERLVIAGSATSLVLVGHEPDLGLLLGFLVTGRSQSIMTFKKGGAAMIEYYGRPEPGSAVVRWVLPPKILRALG